MTLSIEQSTNDLISARFEEIEWMDKESKIRLELYKVFNTHFNPNKGFTQMIDIIDIAASKLGRINFANDKR